MKEIKIATFNINKDDGDFPNRIYKLKEEIGNYHIDIICFQEDFTSDTFQSTTVLNKKLKLYSSSLDTRKKNRNGVVSSSNLTILSRYKPLLEESIFFHETPNEERAALFVIYKIENKKVLLVNTHLCHLNNKNREFQIKTILDKIDTYNIEFIIICGDLNSGLDSKVINELLYRGYKYNNTDVTALRGTCIDYILYKNVDTLDSKIILKEFSDHFCVYNKILLK